MLFWMALVAGLIIGWLVEWLIDWRFWRRDLNASLDDERRWRLDLENARREISRLQDQVAQLSGTATGGDDNGSVSAQKNDEFERIKGIDHTFAQRLHATGIHTFSQLAQLPSKRITEIICPEPQQVIDPASWIAQARKLAKKTQEAS